MYLDDIKYFNSNTWHKQYSILCTNTFLKYIYWIKYTVRPRSVIDGPWTPKGTKNESS